MDAITKQDRTAQLISKTQHLSAWLLGNHLVIAEFPKTTLRLYNSSAAIVWLTLLEQTQTTLDQILNNLASLYDLNVETIKIDVENILTEWCQLDWLECTSLGYRFNSNLSASQIEKVPVHHARQALNQNDLTQAWRAQFSIPLNVELQVDNDSNARLVFERLTAMLGGLPVSDDKTLNTLKGVIHQRGFYIFNNGHCVVNADNHAEGIGQFLYQMIALGHPQEKPLLSLHAAALSKDQQGIIFPGLSGAGKSTLAVLLTNMGWSYMGDDIIGLGVYGNILPLPTAASLKFFDIEAFDQYKDQFNSLATIRYSDKVAKYLPLTNDRIRTLPKPLSAWVFPQYSIGQGFTFEALDPIAVLQKLIESGVGFAENLTHVELERFLNCLEKVPAYCIRYSDIKQVEQWLRTL